MNYHSSLRGWFCSCSVLKFSSQIVRSPSGCSVAQLVVQEEGSRSNAHQYRLDQTHLMMGTESQEGPGLETHREKKAFSLASGAFYMDSLGI